MSIYLSIYEVQDANDSSTGLYALTTADRTVELSLDL